MIKNRILFTLIFSLLLLFTGCGRNQEIKEGSDLEMEKNKNMRITSKLELTSPVFENNGMLPTKYTCDGEGVNPPLSIANRPGGTKSFVLICDDPDAPGGDWVHWLVWNIDPTATEIVEDSVLEGAVFGRTSYGAPGYGAPCPPSGTHRYYFKLYALDKKLELDSSADKAQVLEKMEGHILEKAELMGRYSRS